MARSYWRVYPSFWTDEDVVTWSGDARLLAIYLLTCPHRTTEGFFRLPTGYIADDLRWSLERLREPFGELLANGFIQYDETARVLLIVNALAYQAPENPNQVTAAVEAIAGLPRNGLEQAFLTVAERFAQPLAQRLRERLPERYGKPPAPAPAPTTTPALPEEDAAAVAGAREGEERSSSIEDQTSTPEPKQEVPAYLTDDDPIDDDDPMDALLLELWEVEGWKRHPREDRAMLAQLEVAFYRADLAQAIQELKTKALDGAVKSNLRSALQAFVKQLHLQTPERREPAEPEPLPPPLTEEQKTDIARKMREAAALAKHGAQAMRL